MVLHIPGSSLYHLKVILIETIVQRLLTQLCPVLDTLFHFISGNVSLRRARTFLK